MRSKKKAVIILKIDSDIISQDTASQIKFSKCLFFTKKHDLCKHDLLTLKPMHFNEKACKY